MQRRFVRPVNSLLFVSDRNGGAVPEWADKQILSTASCISVACYPEQDGPTEVVLGRAEEVDPGPGAAFHGVLETPNRSVMISTVTRESILETVVPGRLTKVWVWPNHPRWADKVVVGLG